MSEEENAWQLVPEPDTQPANARKAAKETARLLTWGYRTAMSDLNYVFVLGHCPAEHVEDFTVDTNLRSDDPRSAQFLASMERTARLLTGCDNEPPRS